MKTLFSIPIFSIVVTLALLLPGASQAASYTWSGATSTDWSVGTNWGGTAPADDLTTDIAVFNSAFSNMPTLFADRSVNGLNIGSSIGQASGIYGDFTLALGAGGITNTNTTAGRNFTIATDLEIAATQTWTANASVNSVIDVTGNLSGTGNLELVTPTSFTSYSSQPLPNIRLSGSDNSAYTGNITMTAIGMGIYLSNPGAMIGGNLRIGVPTSGSQSLFLQSGNGTYTFGIGTGAGQITMQPIAGGGFVPWGAM